MTYPFSFSAWIADYVRNGWVTLTLMDLITCEQKYPGLTSDVFIHLWQHRLIEQQLNDERNEPDVS